MVTSGRMLVRDGLVGRQSRPRIVRELELGNSNGRKSEEETAGQGRQALVQCEPYNHSQLVIH